MQQQQALDLSKGAYPQCAQKYAATYVKQLCAGKECKKDLVKTLGKQLRYVEQSTKMNGVMMRQLSIRLVELNLINNPGGSRVVWRHWLASKPQKTL